MISPRGHLVPLLVLLASFAAGWTAETATVTRVVDGDTLVVQMAGRDEGPRLAQGYGFAYVKYPFDRMEEFRRLEREALEKGRSRWARE